MGGNDFLIGLGFGMDVLATLLLFWGFVKYLKLKQFLLVATETEGVVLAVKQYMDNRPAPGQSMAGRSKIEMDDRLVHYKTKMYKPVVAFTADGESILLPTSFSSNKLKTIGEKMTVFYDQSNPEKAYLKEFFWFWPRLLAIFGSILLVIGLASIFAGYG